MLSLLFTFVGAALAQGNFYGVAFTPVQFFHGGYGFPHTVTIDLNGARHDLQWGQRTPWFKAYDRNDLTIFDGDKVLARIPVNFFLNGVPHTIVISSENGPDPLILIPGAIGADHPADRTWIRLAHFAFKGPTVDLWQGNPAPGSPFFVNVTLKDVTEYDGSSKDGEALEFRMVPHGATSPVVVDLKINAVGGAIWNFIAYNDGTPNFYIAPIPESDYGWTNVRITNLRDDVVGPVTLNINGTRGPFVRLDQTSPWFVILDGTTTEVAIESDGKTISTTQVTSSASGAPTHVFMRKDKAVTFTVPIANATFPTRGKAALVAAHLAEGVPAVNVWVKAPNGQPVKILDNLALDQAQIVAAVDPGIYQVIVQLPDKSTVPLEPLVRIFPDAVQAVGVWLYNGKPTVTIVYPESF